MKDIYKVLENFASDALIDKDEYIKMYNESINDSEGFWKKHAKRINWIKNFSKVKDISFDKSKSFLYIVLQQLDLSQQYLFHHNKPLT